MKNCQQCDQEIPVTSAYCEFCGSNQQVKEELLDPNEHQISSLVKKENTTLLVVLCIFTIIGSVFGIGRGLLYELVHNITKTEYTRGWIYIFANIGSLIGAIIVLNRKMTGLYIYSVAQLIYIGTVISAIFSYEYLGLATAFSLFFSLPSAVFLFLYWMNGVRGKLS